MWQSSLVLIVIAMALSISVALTLRSPASAQGVPPGAQGTKPPTAIPPPSVKGAVGHLKTDAGKTTDDVKALDVNKAQQDAGQAKKDVQSLEDSAKSMLNNPLGK